MTTHAGYTASIGEIQKVWRSCYSKFPGKKKNIPSSDTPPKGNMSPNFRDYFSRQYIFQPWFSGDMFCFQGNILQWIILENVGRIHPFSDDLEGNLRHGDRGDPSKWFIDFGLLVLSIICIPSVDITCILCVNLKMISYVNSSAIPLYKMSSECPYISLHIIPFSSPSSKNQKTSKLALHTQNICFSRFWKVPSFWSKISFTLSRLQLKTQILHFGFWWEKLAEKRRTTTFFKKTSNLGLGNHFCRKVCHRFLISRGKLLGLFNLDPMGNFTPPFRVSVDVYFADHPIDQILLTCMLIFRRRRKDFFLCMIERCSAVETDGRTSSIKFQGMINKCSKSFQKFIFKSHFENLVTEFLFKIQSTSSNLKLLYRGEP